jgi:hypothetical protein
VPSKSQVQQIAMAIAKHNPGKLYKRNRGLAKMKSADLSEFASTPRKGLPRRVK